MLAFSVVLMMLPFCWAQASTPPQMPAAQLDDCSKRCLDRFVSTLSCGSKGAACYCNATEFLGTVYSCITGSCQTKENNLAASATNKLTTLCATNGFRVDLPESVKKAAGIPTSGGPTAQVGSAVSDLTTTVTGMNKTLPSKTITGTVESGVPDINGLTTQGTTEENPDAATTTTPDDKTEGKTDDKKPKKASASQTVPSLLSGALLATFILGAFIL